MKSYIATTGAVFALLLLVHIWRFTAEGPHLASDPWFWLITILAGAFSVWAVVLLRSSKRIRNRPPGG